MPKLQYLDLSSNRIRLKQCCTSLLFGTPEIRYLNLSSNAEIGLNLGGLDGLDSLEILDFHHTTVVRVGYLSVLSNCILLRGYRSPGQQECSYDAFVIFSSHDEVWVMNELMENLENGVQPIQLCLHMQDFQAGKSIASNIIDEGIMGSRKIIVVVSQHFLDSAWCRFEFELAQSHFILERSANIIIIILEDVEERKTKKVFGLHKHLKKNT